MSRNKTQTITIGLVLLGPLLLFGRMLLAGEVLYWGTPMLQFVPWHRLALEIIAEGELPLWNALLGTGAPLLANLQSALLYPPNLLLVILGPEHGHGYLVMLHLILAGAGMVLLTRRLGFGQFGQLIAGLSFALSGYMVARAWFISINHAAAWLPWIILGVERLWEAVTTKKEFRGSLPSILLLTLTFVMQWLAGHAQTAWYSLSLVGFWVLWRLIQHRDRVIVVPFLGRLLLVGFLAFCVAAVQLIPTLEYLSLSQRASTLDREFALTYSFWPWKLLGLFLPGLYGSPAQGDYWGYGNFWEDAIYIGILPGLFALSAIWQSLKRSRTNRSLALFLLIVSIVAMLLALGKNTPIFPFLFDFIPTFDLFQAPTRWTLLLTFALAILAGIGADHWGTPKNRGLYWSRLLTAGAGIIALASYIGQELIPGLQPSFIRAFALAGAGLTISGLLTLFLPKQAVAAKLVVVGGFVVIDLLVAGRGLNPSISPEVFEGNVLSTKGILSGERVYMPTDLEERLKFEETHRFDSFDPGIDWVHIREIALPNTPTLDGVASITNFDPIVSERFSNFIVAMQGMPPSIRDELLAWMGVSFRLEADPADQTQVVFMPIASARRTHLISESILVESPGGALEMVTTGGIDLYRQVVIEDPSARDRLGSAEGTILEVSDHTSGRVEVQVEMEEGGWLVLADAWYPGWKGYIDQAEVEITRANYLFKAIHIPQGHHVVEFRYEPPSFRVGAGFSLFGLILIAFLGYQCRRDD